MPSPRPSVLVSPAWRWGAWRWAAVRRRAVVVAAGLEGWVGVLGGAATLGLGAAAGVFAGLEASLGPLAWVLPFGRGGLPAFFMGGTLLVLVRALSPFEGELG